jgi:Uma2 family endonuclease
MNVPLPKQMDKSAFLAWLQDREARYELIEGRKVPTIRRSRAHAIIATNVMCLVHSQLDERLWTVLLSFGVDAGPKTLRFPDVVVDKADGNGADRAATAPALLAGVLSRSGELPDLQDEWSEYLKLPSLWAYLVFDQTELRATAWVRGTEEFSTSPKIVVGQKAAIEVSPLGLNLPLCEIYRGTRLS